MTAANALGGAQRAGGWRRAIAEAPRRAEVLIVDDEAELRRSLQRLVTALGYNATVAASAEQADLLLSQGRYEVCLLDVELPGMSGTEFLDWALTRDEEMAVIMLTGLDVPELAVESVDRGARTYLVKPFDADFLRLALRDALAMRRLLVERNALRGEGAYR